MEQNGTAKTPAQETLEAGLALQRAAELDLTLFNTTEVYGGP